MPIVITRLEFTDRFGIVPPSDIVGICFTTSDGTAVLEEYIFDDEDGREYEVTELERMLSLS